MGGYRFQVLLQERVDLFDLGSEFAGVSTLEVKFRLDFARADQLHVQLLLNRLKLVSDSRQNVVFGRLRASFSSGSRFSTFSTFSMLRCRARWRPRNVAFHGQILPEVRSMVRPLSGATLGAVSRRGACKYFKERCQTTLSDP